MTTLLISSCHNDSPSKDNEENRYYSGYRNIYKAYGSVPLDSTSQQLNSYLKEFPQNALAWAFYGNICFREAKNEEAIASYRKAISIDDTKAAYYAALGTALNAANETDSAAFYLYKALELKDSSANTLLNLSMLYLKKNDEAKSLIFAAAAQAVPDSSALTLAGLSFVYAHFNEKEKSETALNSAKGLGLPDTVKFRKVLNGEGKIEDYYRKYSY